MLGTAKDSAIAVGVERAVAAVTSLEAQVLDAAGRGEIEGLVLRYGLFYGPSNPATQDLLASVRKRRLPRIRNDRGQLPFIHLNDAVSATVAALNRGSSGSVYNVVDDEAASFSSFVLAMAEVSGSPAPFVVPEWVLRVTAPSMSRLFTARLQATNTKTRTELVWAPQFPSYRDGLRQTIGQLSSDSDN
jgi:nucleoside-diphosphate-sugar epimerase